MKAQKTLTSQLASAKKKLSSLQRQLGDLQQNLPTICATDPTNQGAADGLQPPYYILAQRPGDDGATFQLTSALNAFQRDNLSAFVSASVTYPSAGHSIGRRTVPC